ncbi:MAG: triosephosphate isomerase [Planctomycetota bacterium]
MHTTPAEAAKLAQGVVKALAGFAACDVALCPPYVCLAAVGDAVRGTSVKLGAQNCHGEIQGAFTGEVSAPMLKALGVTTVILGHSERRQFFGETDAGVHARLKGVLAEGLEAIVCVGETLEQRQQNITKDVVGHQVRAAFNGFTAAQMAKVTVAYEPVWAIGTGLTASPAQAQEVHAFIRGMVAQQFGPDAAAAMRIQYGGSVKPNNAKELFSQPDIDGGLIGGASLKVEDFAAIVKAGA